MKKMGAFSSNARSDEIRISLGLSVGIKVQGPMGTPRKRSLIVVATCFTGLRHCSRSNELTRTQAACDFATKHAASCTSIVGAMGTATTPSASTASIATMYP